MLSHRKIFNVLNQNRPLSSTKVEPVLDNTKAAWDIISKNYMRHEQDLHESLEILPKNQRYAFLASFIPTLSDPLLEKFKGDAYKLYPKLPEEHHGNLWNLMQGLELEANTVKTLPEIPAPTVGSIKKESVEDAEQYHALTMSRS